jgi:mRNA-degrading endonuclease RelE of RelBE toxin-antitoxin system
VSFALEFRRNAQRELEALHAEIRSRVQRRIDELVENPHPHDALKLHGSDDV